MVCAALAVLALGCGAKTATNAQTTTIRVSEASAATVLPAQPATLSQPFKGSSFTIDAEPAPGLSTTIHHFVATGSPGIAQIDALLVLRTHEPTAAKEQCPQGPDGKKPMGYPVEVVSLTWVQTYDDGSAFSAAIVNRQLWKTNESTRRLEPEVDAKGRPKRVSVADPAKESAPIDAERPPAKACSDGTRFSLAAQGRILRAVGPIFENWDETTGAWSVTVSMEEDLTEGTVKVSGLGYAGAVSP